VYTGGTLAEAAMLPSGFLVALNYTRGVPYIWSADTNTTVIYKVDGAGD
jgi:hypothetical protein